MRFLLPASLALMLSASPLGAQLPDKAYIGLTWDENHSQNCIPSPVGAPQELTMYVWALPSSRGMATAAFGLPVIIGDGVTGVSLAQNSPVTCGGSTFVTPSYSEWSFTFCGCQTGWTWLLKETLLVSSGVTMNIHLRGLAWWNDEIKFLSCTPEDPENPYEPVTRWTDLIMGGPCTLGVSPSTWSAIKSLYR